MKWKGVIIVLLLFGMGFVSGYGLFSYMGGGKEASIDVIGSTTVFPIAKAAANEYMKQHQGITVNVKGGGSGYGYSTVISGKANIGTHSRKPKNKEIQNAKDNNVNLTLYAIGIDALTVIVNPKVVSGVENITLTRKRIGKIYSGQITNWQDVDPSLPNKPIVLYDRESGSGTREVFLSKCVDAYNYTVDPGAKGVESNKEMRQNVADTDGAIGYIGLGYLTEDVSPVMINESGTIFNPPKLESGGSGSKNLSAYPLMRELYMSTDGAYWKAEPLVTAFLRFVMSERGGTLIKEAGYFDIIGERVYKWSTVQTWA